MAKTALELWGEALTPREREVLLHAAYSHREAAQLLGVKHGTIKNHRVSIYSKLLGPRSPEWKEAHSPRIMSLLLALGLGIITLKEIKHGTKREQLENY